MDPPELGSFQFFYQALIEGALWAGVPLDSSVLQVDSPSLSLAGEVHPQDRRVWPLFAWQEGEHHVTWRSRFDVTQGRAVEEPAELLDKLADLSSV